MEPFKNPDLPFPPEEGQIFWFTGLSSAGKSANARLLANYLRSIGRTCVLLDGDELRSAIDASNCFTRDDRVRLGIQYGKLCAMLAAQGINVIIATIALYDEIHAWKEENIPECCTIFLDVPLEELRRRDPKKIYQRYFNKELTNVAGLDLSIDKPCAPTIHIKWQPGMNLENTWTIIQNEIEKYLEK